MIELPWPPSSLSGHANGHWRGKAAVTAKYRAWAKAAAMAAGAAPSSPSGDIRLIITFYPPDRRSDRVNFANRMKPYFDGIADAMGVNDSRFLPVYQFAEPVKNARVTVVVDDGEPRQIGAILNPILANILERTEAGEA